MFSSFILVWISRFLSIITFLTSVLTFWRVFRGELTAVGTFPAHYCLLTFLILSIVFSLLVLTAASAQLPDGASSFGGILNLIVPLSVALSSILTALYLSGGHFYLRKEKVEFILYFESEMDIIVITILWRCLLVGISNRYERTVASWLLVLKVILIFIPNRNWFATAAMLLIIARGLSGFSYSEEVDKNPISDKGYLFQDVRLLLLVIICWCGAIWNMMDVNKNYGAFFDSSFWQKFSEYSTK